MSAEKKTLNVDKYNAYKYRCCKICNVLRYCEDTENFFQCRKYRLHLQELARTQDTQYLLKTKTIHQLVVARKFV